MCRPEVVQVVGFRLDTIVADAFDLLDHDERDRADRFAFDRDRGRFVIAHALTRLILGDCLGCPPSSLRFQAGPNGKPRLTGRTDINFNLSHSGNWALLAVSVARDVGIDLEACRPVAIFELARRFFSPAECLALEALPEPERIPAFFRCWTRKEAFIKALGEGLAFPLDGFEVSVTDDRSSQVLRACPHAPEALDYWNVRALRMGRGYEAAVAARGTTWRTLRWHFVHER